MNTNKFSIFKSFDYGFKTFYQHLFFNLKTLLTLGLAAGGAILGMGGIFFLCCKVKSSTMTQGFPFFQGRIDFENHWIILILFILIFLFFTGLSLGFTRIALDLYDEGKSEVKRLFSCFRLTPKVLGALFLPFLLLAVCMFLGVAIGFPAILICVPFVIYLAIRCCLFLFFILDQNSGIIESFKQSYRATSGHAWKILGFLIVAGILNGIGNLIGNLHSILALLELAILYPVICFAWVSMYRQLVPKENLEVV